MAGIRTGLFTASNLDIEVSLEPGVNAFSNIVALHAAQAHSGFDEWVTSTLAKLTPTQKKVNRILTDGLYGLVDVHRSWPSFGALLKDLTSRPSDELRDRVLDMLCQCIELEKKETDGKTTTLNPESLLANRDLYLENVRIWFTEDEFDLKFQNEIFDLLTNANDLKDLVVSHLESMWDEHLERDWKANLHLLRDAVTAFQEIDLSNLPVEDVIRTVLGRNLMLSHNTEHDFSETSKIIFIPSAHVGPYAVMFKSKGIVRCIFGAHLMDHLTENSTGTSRSEVLVRLSALADNSRLQILELLKENEELYAQDVISKLGLSQSSASRHLIHLCAAGFLIERRGERGKCYSVNKERIEESLTLLKRHLLA
jgi:DNA-binding transcriptional ArsR family regulator